MSTQTCSLTTPAILVYSKPFGKLMCHAAGTDDPVLAADAVARRFNEIEKLESFSSQYRNMRLSNIRCRWSLGPFLAVVPCHAR